MYYAIFDSQGERITSYSTHIHGDIPKEAIEITDEEQILYSSGMYIRDLQTGKPVKKELPTPTLEEIQATKWEEIKANRDRAETAGFEYMGKLLDSDPLSVQRIAIAVQAAQAVLSAGHKFALGWTCTDNSVLDMTAAEIIGMPVALAQHSNALHEKARLLREAINAATTIEEVGAISWEST